MTRGRLLQYLVAVVGLLACGAPAHAAKKIQCPDGVRYEIDVKRLAIEYSATGLEATLSGLSVLGGRVAVSPKTLQQAAVATQKLNEFVKALAVGYNGCAIGRKAYEEGIKGLLPAMQSDGKALEALRQQLLDNRKIDAARLEKLLAAYNEKLQRLAKLSGKGIDYERIGAVVDEELPIGFTKRRIGFDRVANTCAACHTASYRTKPDENPTFVVAGPSHTLDLEAFFRFLVDCAKDPRFNPDNLMAEINMAADLDFIDRLAYRYLIIPITKKRLIEREGQFRWIYRHDFPELGPRAG
jgi:hypothetical protein